jgi:hypothetical protein
MEPHVTQQRLYKYTAIGRPLDPSWPSNNAVLILLPLAALTGLGWSLIAGEGIWPALHRAVIFALAVFGCWALARELLPDDHVAAFVSLALGFLAAIAFLTPGLLVLFTTIGLVRVLNRSSGLRARISDSIMVTLLVIWTVYATQSPWFGAVAALAFFLDGVLRKPCKRQWLFALICFGSMVVYIVDYDVTWWPLFVPDTLLKWLAVLAALLFFLHLVLLKKVDSRDDVKQEQLDLARVKAGMVIGVLATLQGLESMPQVILPLASIGGLCIGITFRRAFRSPVKNPPAS